MPRMDIAKLIQDLGGVTAVARICGVRAPSVHEWRERGVIPADRCAAIEAASGGKVTVEELQPGFEWRRDRTGRVTGYFVPTASPARAA